MNTWALKLVRVFLKELSSKHEEEKSSTRSVHFGELKSKFESSGFERLFTKHLFKKKIFGEFDPGSE